jgi:hypothetical protein
LVNGDEGGDVSGSDGGPGDLAGHTGTPSRLEMWHGFAQQPGTHLRWESAGGRRAELRTTEQQTIATVRRSFGFEGRMTVSAAGRSFTVNRVKIPDPGHPRSWPPGITGIVGQPEGSQEPDRAVRARVKSLRELVDETGTPVLYTTGMQHFDHRAKADVRFPDQRCLQFPVWGAFKAHAIMTAVDQDGNKLAQYRVPSLHPFRQKVEITVHPDWKLTDELVLVIAISAPWLHSYFLIEGGGG